MNTFLRRFLMHYGIYRRYPLGRLPALRNARCEVIAPTGGYFSNVVDPCIWRRLLVRDNLDRGTSVVSRPLSSMARANGVGR